MMLFPPPIPAVPADPVLYLAGWASHRTPGHWGPRSAPRLSIMLHTPKWASYEGTVMLMRASTPAEADDLKRVLRARNGGWDDPQALARYRGSMESRWEDLLGKRYLSPGMLSYASTSGEYVSVPTGATLCCSCSVSEAASGRCHRAWMSTHLRRAGWSIVLDGKIVHP